MPTVPAAFRRPLILAALLFWAGLAIASLIVSAERVGHPFPGFIVSANLYLGNTDLADWSGARAGLLPLDRIVSIDGQILTEANELIDRVKAAPAGTPFAYALADGRTVTVRSMTLTWWEFLRSAFPFWLAAVGHLGLGGWVLLQRPTLTAAVGHWRYCQIFALFCLAAVFGERWPFWNAINLIGAALMLPALVELVLTFPAQAADPRAARRIRLAGWLVGGATGLFVLVGVWNEAWFPLAFNMAVLVPSVALFGALGAWSWQAFSSRFPAPTRGQARLALLGLGLSLVPSVYFAGMAMLGHPQPGFEFAFVGFLAFPAAIALAIVRYQAFDLNYVLRRATFYALLTTSLGAVYVAAALAGHWLLGRLASPIEGASVPGFLAALAVAWAFRPGYQGLQALVDRWFLGDRPDPLGTVAAFTAEAEGREADEIAGQLATAVRGALGASWVQFRWSGQVVAAGARPPGAVPAVEAVIRPQEGPLGGVEVGPRDDDMPYGPQERALLEVLASQAALALDRALLFEARLRLGMGEAAALGRAEAREQLLKQVVHDLGTELSNIAVAADLARQLPGEAGPIESIQASLLRIERFLADKRYRLQGDRQARTTIGAGFELALLTLSPQLEAKGQRFEAALDDREVALPLSEVELAQVIVNVVANASKFSPPGGAIRLAAERHGGFLRLRVEDDGPGVPEEMLATIGDGRRGDPAVPGSGFGLQNCRALVTAVGGALAWRNGDRGAVIELKLPVLA